MFSELCNENSCLRLCMLIIVISKFLFYQVFEGGLSQHLAAYSQGERDAWLQAIQLASYDCMRSQLLALQQRMETRRGQDPDLDIHMWRVRNGHSVGKSLF